MNEFMNYHHVINSKYYIIIIIINILLLAGFTDLFCIIFFKVNRIKLKQFIKGNSTKVKTRWYKNEAFSSQDMTFITPKGIDKLHIFGQFFINVDLIIIKKLQVGVIFSECGLRGGILCSYEVHSWVRNQN